MHQIHLKFLKLKYLTAGFSTRLLQTQSNYSLLFNYSNSLNCLLLQKQQDESIEKYICLKDFK